MARTVWESIEVAGHELATMIRKLIDEGNVRRIRIRQGQRVVAEFPLTVGVVGAMFAPMLAAVGALTALVTECTIDVEREVASEPAEPAQSTAESGQSSGT